MKDLTTGKEGSLIFYFAVPMLFGNVFQQLYNVVDSIIVGQYLGKEALAAVGSCFPIIFLLISLIIGIATGTTILIAQYFGAKDFKSIKRCIDTMYISLFFASFIITALGLIFGEKVFELLKMPAELFPQTKLYLNIYLLGIITFFGFNGTSAVLRGLGDSKTPLYFLIISSVLNIILDLLFIVVFKWGIAGAATATIISQGFAFIAAIIYLNKYHKIINISFRNIEFDKSILIKTLKIGLPTGFQQSFVALGMMALLRIVNDFGTSAIAAYTVGSRIVSFITMPALDFSSALSTFVGQNIGANKLNRVKKGFLASLLMISIISVSITIIVMLFASNIMAIFSPDSEVIKIGTSYLMIVSAFFIFFSTMFIIQGLLRGVGDTLIPMFITLIALWFIRIPFSYFLSQKIGLNGIWWGIPIAWFISFLLSYIYYLTGKWKTKVVIKPLGS